MAHLSVVQPSVEATQHPCTFFMTAKSFQNLEFLYFRLAPLSLFWIFSLRASRRK